MKYQVSGYRNEVQYYSTTIEADSPQEAREKARKLFREDPQSYIIDTDHVVDEITDVIELKEDT